MGKVEIRLKKVEIQLGHEETDVVLVLPDGKKIELQYRLESPSIDVCLPTEWIVTCWKGEDMAPADAMCGHTPAENKHYAPGHVRRARQLVIDIPPEHVD